MSLPEEVERPLDELDLRRVLVEIDEEVARRRADGEIPPGLEHELDATFARFSPAAATGGDTASILDAVERSAFIDVDVPTASGIPAGPVLKRSLRKVMAWYLRYVAQQTSAFNAAVVRALRSVDERLAALEQSTATADPRLHAALDALPSGSTPPELVAVAVDELRGGAGRVLVADAGDGTVVGALAEVGVDAYGVDHRRTVANRALAAGHDVRVGDVADHLAGVAPGALGGVVLTGVVDRLPVPGALALAEAVAAALAPGAVLVLRSTSPGAWARARDEVVVDLSPGRPLAAATWRTVLEHHGLAVDAVHPGPTPAESLVDLPPEAPGADVVNANNAVLRTALLGPASYVVVARRVR